MTKTLNKLIAIFLLSISTLLLSACDFDQIENKYDTYDEAQEANLFARGWIPNELTFKSMQNIYLLSNIDLNTCFFSYRLSKNHYEQAVGKLKLSKYQGADPRRVNIPNRFQRKMSGLNQFILLKKDTIFVKVDPINHIVYGWY